jgi:hypothetical protein
MRKYTFSPILLSAFVFSMLAAGPFEFSTTNNNTADNWLSIENDNFVIYYKAGFLSDANLMLNYCEYARNITMNLYPHNLPFEVTVKLYDYNTFPYSIGTTMASVSSTSAELSFISPSDVPTQYKSYMDNLWYQKNTVHEYVHVPTYIDLLSTSWYRSSGFPGFFDVAEYFSVFCTTPEILQKYNYYIEDHDCPN